VKLSGVEAYFDQLFYVEQGSKAAIIKNYLKTKHFSENVTFIDDMPTHLENFNQLIPNGTVIRIRRPRARGSDVEDSRFKTCANLEEFSAIINN